MTDSRTNTAVALLRDRRAHPFARLLLSLIAGAGAAAIAVFAAWLWGMFVPRYYPTGSGGAMQARYYVTDEMLSATLVVAAWMWLTVLWFIWRFSDRGRPFLAAALITFGVAGLPILGVSLCDQFGLGGLAENWTGGTLTILAAVITAAAWIAALAGREGRSRQHRVAPRMMLWSGATVVATAIAAVLVDRATRDEEEYLIAAIVLIGSALFLALWLPLVYRGIRQPLEAETGEINVLCPKCGYSLVGLAELRCPECGERFTIDALIRSQHYARVERQPGPPL